MAYRKLRGALILLFLLIAAMALAGCAAPENDGEPATTAPPMTLRVYLTDSGRNMADAPKVNEKINEYILPLLGFQVDIQYLPNLNYSNTLGQKFLSAEAFDILYYQYYSDVENGIREGWLLPLDELLASYGPAISQVYTPEFLDYYRQDRPLYFLPTNRDWASDIGVEYNVEMEEKYGIDMSVVHTLEDLTEIYARLHELDPDIFPVAEPAAYTWDGLGDELGVLLDMSQPVVSNLFASDEFCRMCELTYDWAQKGYSLDMSSYTSITIDYLGSGRVFSSISYGKPDFATQESRTTGIPIGYIPLSGPFSTSQKLWSSFLAINAFSQHPKEAMQFLNLMYSDAYLANLMVYGIENVHYVFKNAEKTVIGFPEGINCTNSRYAKLLNWQYANSFLTYAWEGDTPDIWQKMDEFNRSSLYSVAFGFRYDPTPVGDAVEACKKVKAQYRNGLLQGNLDPEEMIPRFLAELNQAGIDQVIAEKQRQLDEWLARRGKQ